MKEQFCDYKISLKLKELGFDEPCFACWTSDSKLEIFPFFIDAVDYNKVLSGNYTLSAPLYQQAQSWFREKHKILVEVKPLDSWNSWVYLLVCEDAMSLFFEIRNSNEYSTYEEALEAAILKIIELIESK